MILPLRKSLNWNQDLPDEGQDGNWLRDSLRWDILSHNWRNEPKTLTTLSRISQWKRTYSSSRQRFTASRTIDTKKLNQFGYKILSYPPYSLDLSPTDYHYFKNLDNFLRDKYFRNQDDAKNAFIDLITSITPEFCVTVINKLISRWSKCVKSNGLHFN